MKTRRTKLGQKQRVMKTLAGDAASNDISDNEAQVEGEVFQDGVEEESGGGALAKLSQSPKVDEGYESDVEMVTDATHL
ncbi:hypothetical protein FRC04_001383 [Tulasnella sp. 424]|nr:hypothetical protein FRC04_001383 [Tulasnella sp. 424]